MENKQDILRVDPKKISIGRLNKDTDNSSVTNNVNGEKRVYEKN